MNYESLKSFCENKANSFDDKYKKRLNEELKIIKLQENEHKESIYDYFSRCIEYVKNNGKIKNTNHLLISYLIDITDEDPIKLKMDLILTKSPEFPDIDTDFEDSQRERVKEYITNKYGKNNVASIIAFGRMKAKAAIKDVSRVKNVPLEEVDMCTKSMGTDDKLNEINNNVTAKAFFKQWEHIGLYDKCLKLEGNVRHCSKHAAGIVISPIPIDEVVGLQVVKGHQVTCWEEGDDRELSKVGLIKFDLLGLNTLTVIKNAIKLIKQNYNIDIDIENISLNDKNVIKLFHDAETIGVFQFEKPYLRNLLKKIKMNSFNDIAAVNALNRPGPMDAGMGEVFWKRKSGIEEVTYLHKDLKPILSESQGIILYQEQIIAIANQLAGMTIDEADEFRKILGKGKSMLAKGINPFEKHYKKFLNGCIKNGIIGTINITRTISDDTDIPTTATNLNTIESGLDKDGKEYKKINCSCEIADELWYQIQSFARYGFNKSHSVGYGVTAYQCAYLKVYYPKEFMASVLSLTPNAEDNSDHSNKFVDYFNETKRMKINILPPSINKSEYNFKVIGDEILSGFGFIKGLGTKAIEEINTKRPFINFNDFIIRVNGTSCPKTSVLALINSGCFDEFIGVKEDKNNIIKRINLIETYLKGKKGKEDSNYKNLNYSKLIELESEVCGDEIFNNSLGFVDTKSVNDELSIDDKIHNINKLENLCQGDSIRVFGKIESISFTKSENPIAFVNIKNKKKYKFIMWNNDVKKMMKNEELKEKLKSGNIITFRAIRNRDYQGSPSYGISLEEIKLMPILK